MEWPEPAVGLAEFLSAYRPSIVILSGTARGMELTLDQPRVTMGRGPGVDLCFDDPAMSREHAAIEFVCGRFQIRRLEAASELVVNGGDASCVELKSEDRFRLGGHSFQFMLEERRAPLPSQ